MVGPSGYPGRIGPRVWDKCSDISLLEIWGFWGPRGLVFVPPSESKPGFVGIMKGTSLIRFEAKAGLCAC